MTNHDPAVSESDFRCGFCGYDLSGAAVGGTCSECGAPVIETIRQQQHVPVSCGAATTSLILGILSLLICGLMGPLAIIFGVRALSQIKAGGYTAGARGMAIAGLVLGVIATALIVLFLGAVVIGEML